MEEYCLVLFGNTIKRIIILEFSTGHFAIGEYITKEAATNLMIMLEDFYYEYNVVMMRKSSPFTNKMTDFIGRLHETGLLLAWETQVHSAIVYNI